MVTPPDPNEQSVNSESNLDTWVRSVRAGDREAYRQIIEACEAKVRIILAAMLPEQNDVDDIAQEVFVTAYTKLGEYEVGSDFVAWIKAITRNLALNERRRWFRQARFKDKFEAEMEASLEPFVTDFGGRYEGNVLEALRDCLRRLEEPSRRITEDFYFHDLSGEEIARRHERKAGWVRLILFRARTAIAACLQKKGVG
jgi:RNA polymerase sigma-70 factor (ECF subfamily)